MTKDDLDKKAKNMIKLNELFIDGKREGFYDKKKFKIPILDNLINKKKQQKKTIEGFGGEGSEATTTIRDDKCVKWSELDNDKWNADNPISDAFPDDDLGDHNKCRNPDKDENGAWCFTSTKSDGEFGYCTEKGEKATEEAEESGEPIGDKNKSTAEKQEEVDIGDVIVPLISDLIKACVIPYIILYLGTATVQIFKCYEKGAMLPGQNLGLTPYTKYGSDPNSSFLSHKNYGFPYDMKGSNPSAKGIIRETVKHTWHQARSITDMLLNTFRSIAYSDSLAEDNTMIRERSNVKMFGVFKGATGIIIEFLWNAIQMILLIVLLVVAGLFSIYLLPIIAVILGVWQQIDVAHTPVLPIPEFILSMIPPGVPVPKNPLMIHVLSTWGAPLPLQLIGIIVYFGISIGIAFPLVQLMSMIIPVYVIYFLILRPIFNKTIRTACSKWFKYYTRRYYMILALIVSLGISLAIFKNFGGKGKISNALRNLGVPEMVVMLVSWIPAIVMFFVYCIWWGGGYPFKGALTSLRNEDKPPSKSDLCDALKFQNKGGQIPNPYDLLKPIKEMMKNPLEFIFDFFQKIAGSMKEKPAAKPTTAKPGAPPKQAAKK